MCGEISALASTIKQNFKVGDHKCILEGRGRVFVTRSLPVSDCYGVN